jgi:hypothetical protein
MSRHTTAGWADRGLFSGSGVATAVLAVMTLMAPGCGGDPTRPGHIPESGAISLSLKGPASAERGTPVLITFEATAEQGVDRIVITWGDGSPPDTVRGAGSTTLTGTVGHVFGAGGEYTVEAVAWDAGGEQASARHDLRILAAVTGDTLALSVNRSVRFQVMDGWGFSLPSAASMALGLNPLATFPFEAGADDIIYARLFDPVQGLGMTHMGVFAGWDVEGFWSGAVRRTYEDTNDNSDPFVINWSGFDLSPDWPNWKVMQKAAERGAALIHKGTVPDWMKTGSQFGTGMEAEFAEHLTAFLLFARDNMDLDIPLVIPFNEPNTSSPARFTPQQFAGAVRALAEMLDARGLPARLVAPEGSSVTASRTFAEALLQDPVIRGRLAALGAHPYGGDNTSNWRAMAELGRAAGVPVWQGEYSTHETTGGLDFTIDDGIQLARDIRRHLVTGDVALWFYLLGIGCLCGEHGGASASLMLLEPEGGSAFQLRLPYRYHAFGQFSRYVRPGAVRVEVTGSSSSVEPIAFQTPGGGVAVVLINRGASDVVVRLAGLGGVGSLLRTRTAEGEEGVAVGVDTVAGGTATFRIPGQSITTVTSDPP